MTPIAAYGAFFRNSFDFSGRACRGAFWWPTLFNNLLAGAIGGAAIAGYLFVPHTPLPMVALGVQILFLVATMIPVVTVTIRRFHDVGLSGWWTLLGMIPLVGPLAMIVIAARASSPEENRWGSAPTDADSGSPGAPVGAVDVTARPTGRKAKPHNPWQGYAVLFEAERPKSDEELAANRERVLACYRERVLGGDDADLDDRPNAAPQPG